MRSSYKLLVVLFFVCGTVLRILLYWANPPDNYFDNHFMPIIMIMDSGTLPAKDACFQCYHPPFFYWTSAMIGKAAEAMKIKMSQLLKLLQFLSCFYGICTLGIIFLILQKLPLSGFSRLLAFCAVCFLPRDIYMSAINSNDSISSLFVALSVYVLFLTIERSLHPFILLLLSIVISTAIFTKYTAYVVLPIVCIVFVSLFYRRLIASRKQVALSLILVLLLPITMLSAYFISNKKNYGSPLPGNIQKLNPLLTYPHDTPRLDFISFKPWESIRTAILVPGKMHSFWTLVYNGMWFDNEPKFLHFLDSNKCWWNHYYGWLKGKEKYPGDNLSLSPLTKITGVGLVTLGLFPFILILSGFYHFARSWKGWQKGKGLDMAKMGIFPTLLLSNTAGIIALAIQWPVYSSMKASYFLISLPAFAAFLGLGLMLCEKNKKLKYTVVIIFCLLFGLVGVHILQIVHSLL